MAGLGESCSHIGAVLFYLDFMARQRANRTVTGEKSYWAAANIYPVATDDEMSQLYEELSQSGTKSPILSIIPPFSKNCIPKSMSKKYPTIIAELYNPANLQFRYKQLLGLAMSTSVSCTKDQVELVMQ